MMDPQVKDREEISRLALAIGSAGSERRITVSDESKKSGYRTE
jgi:hypothetical protein